MTRVAVVGHLEWVDFVEVARVPRQGELVEATGNFARAAGGGGVAAATLAELGAEVDFFCALGRDAHGEAAVEELKGRGVSPHVAWRDQPTRRAVTLLDPEGERTIVTIGERLEPLGEDELPWAELAHAAGVYFTAGDRGALERARHAGVLVASPRAGTDLVGDGAPRLDALVFSEADRAESATAERLKANARVLVATEGQNGGRWWGAEEGSWDADEPPGQPRDAYGCGDSFAAGFTFGLAEEGSVRAGAEVGACCGARCLTRSGAP